MRIGSLFAGIGGLELGLEMAGLGPVAWQVEADPFCRRVLARHWPEVPRHEDVRTVDPAILEPVEIVCGGFPCQDVSSAGLRKGLAGERSGLWREFARIVRAMRPQWVVVENVASGARLWLDAVVRDLGELGYEALPVPLAASDVGAPHRRARIFVIARLGPGEVHEHAANSNGHELRNQQRRIPDRPGTSELADDGKARNAPDADRERQHAGAVDAEMAGAPESSDAAPVTGVHARPHRQRGAPDGAGRYWQDWPAVSPVRRDDDGLPDEVDRTKRIKALGNAVVPQCAEVIGWMIRESDGL